MTSTLTFDVEPFGEDGSVFVVVPVVDGHRLTDLIHSLERQAGMEDRDTSYAGLIPAFFRFGTATEHYRSTHQRIPLLGCECGEWGCWPLMAQIRADDERVVWTEFEQPHRSTRDYTAFGPFSFERSAYDEALRDLEPRWDPSAAR
jgi:hypothetical protein